MIALLASALIRLTLTALTLWCAHIIGAGSRDGILFRNETPSLPYLGVILPLRETCFVIPLCMVCAHLAAAWRRTMPKEASETSLWRSAVADSAKFRQWLFYTTPSFSLLWLAYMFAPFKDARVTFAHMTAWAMLRLYGRPARTEPETSPPLRFAMRKGFEAVSGLCRYALIAFFCFLLFRNFEVTYIDITGKSFADLQTLSLSGRNFSGIRAEKAVLEKGDFSESDLTDGMFREAKLSRARMEHTVLRRAFLLQADMRETDARHADMRNAQCERATLAKADLRSADLSGVTLYATDLSGADLRQTRLAGAFADRGRFQRARLEGADFSDASLHYADFRGVDLSSAGFKDAYLFGSDFTGAVNADKADRTGATFNRAQLKQIETPTRFPAGFDPEAHGMTEVGEPEFQQALGRYVKKLQEKYDADQR